MLYSMTSGVCGLWGFLSPDSFHSDVYHKPLRKPIQILSYLIRYCISQPFWGLIHFILISDTHPFENLFKTYNMCGSLVSVVALLSPDSSHSIVCHKPFWKPVQKVSDGLISGFCGNPSEPWFISFCRLPQTHLKPYSKQCLICLYGFWAVLSFDSSYSDLCQKLLWKHMQHWSYSTISGVCGLSVLLSLDRSHSDVCHKRIWKPIQNLSHLFIYVCGFWTVRFWALIPLILTYVRISFESLYETCHI